MDSVKNGQDGPATLADDVQQQAADPVREAAPSDPPASDRDGFSRDRLLKEKNELQELLIRRQAEFENYRRRVERERSELFEFASMDSVKALLPMLDDFERALKVECADKEYSRGMELIYQRIYESLKKLGLEPISTEGAKFDPHIHHAVDMVETHDHPDQTILKEYQHGYYFKNRLLRPAMVQVAVNQ
jgi:molecular chaperone GrpE